MIISVWQSILVQFCCLQVLDQRGVGQLIKIATERGRAARPSLKVIGNIAQGACQARPSLCCLIYVEIYGLSMLIGHLGSFEKDNKHFMIATKIIMVELH